MDLQGSGGFGAVSVGLSPLVFGGLLLVVVLVILGLWKLARMIWMSFSG